MSRVLVCLFFLEEAFSYGKKCSAVPHDVNLQRFKLMGEICSLCKQAWLCGVTTNYTSWGYSPSFLITLFFHIRERKEMGDVREKMKEKTQHGIYRVLAITFLSLCMENTCMLQSTLMCAWQIWALLPSEWHIGRALLPWWQLPSLGAGWLSTAESSWTHTTCWSQWVHSAGL